MRDLPLDENYYEKVLDNFEQFCDEFEFAAAKRFSGVDNESTAPLTNEGVKSGTPEVIREVDEVGEDDILARASAVDVQATEVPEA